MRSPSEARSVMLSLASACWPPPLDALRSCICRMARSTCGRASHPRGVMWRGCAGLRWAALGCAGLRWACAGLRDHAT
jgi:hypothetical protein